MARLTYGVCGVMRGVWGRVRPKTWASARPWREGAAAPCGARKLVGRVFGLRVVVLDWWIALCALDVARGAGGECVGGCGVDWPRKLFVQRGSTADQIATLELEVARCLYVPYSPRAASAESPIRTDSLCVSLGPRSASVRRTRRCFVAPLFQIRNRTTSFCDTREIRAGESPLLADFWREGCEGSKLIKESGDGHSFRS